MKPIFHNDASWSGSVGQDLIAANPNFKWLAWWQWCSYRFSL